MFPTTLMRDTSKSLILKFDNELNVLHREIVNDQFKHVFREEGEPETPNWSNGRRKSVGFY